MLRVSEIFYSIQGEGRFLGRPSTFLRLSRCNLQCVFCDTPYTWRFASHLPHRDEMVYMPSEQERSIEVEEVFKQIKSRSLSHVVITGGEPLLQPFDILMLLRLLDADTSRRWTVEFETAGTLPPVDNRDLALKLYYTVSPKLASSGNSMRMRRRLEHLNELAGEDSVFKFVVCSSKDLDEVDELVRLIGIEPSRVYLMAEGIDAETINRGTGKLMRDAVVRGFNLTTRLQVLMYGNKRGV